MKNNKISNNCYKNNNNKINRGNQYKYYNKHKIKYY